MMRCEIATINNHTSFEIKSYCIYGRSSGLLPLPTIIFHQTITGFVGGLNLGVKKAIELILRNNSNQDLLFWQETSLSASLMSTCTFSNCLNNGGARTLWTRWTSMQSGRRDGPRPILFLASFSGSSLPSRAHETIFVVNPSVARHRTRLENGLSVLLCWVSIMPIVQD